MSKRVLIAEDEFVSRKVLRSFLAPHMDVEIAANGEEAVKAFQMALDEDKPYHLILMDIMMPGITGIQALQSIRDLERERGGDPTPVIMVTALDDPKAMITSFHDAGASGYIVKPVQRDMLFMELEKLGINLEDKDD